MNFKISIYFLLFSIWIVSCTSEPRCGTGGIKESTGRTSFIKVSGESSNHTRNDETSQRGLAAGLYSALIYLLDDSPDPVIQSVITAGSSGEEDMTLTELTAGTSLGEIRENITQIFVVGNWNSSDAGGNYADFPTTPGATFSEILSTVLNINEVAYWAIDSEEVNPNILITVMDGLAELTDYTTDPAGWTGQTGPNDGDIYADVTILPVVSRLELDSVEVAIGSNQYTNYGWFINNFYPELSLSLETEGFSMIRNGSDGSRYDTASPSYAYTDYATMAEIINTSVDLPTDEDVVWSSEGGCYAYHVFGNSPSPEIVFRFTDLTFRDSTTAQQRYHTIRGFRDQNGNEITVLERNRIYWFDGYSIGSLTDTPDPDLTGDLWVNVRVEPWVSTIVTVEPD